MTRLHEINPDAQNKEEHHMTTKIKEYMSVSDLAAMLGIGYSTAYRLMQMLPHVNIAPPGSRYRTLRVSQREVDKYLRQREVRR